MDLRAQRLRHRRIRKQRTAGVMLNPLAEVGVGVLVAVLVRRGQFVVDFQRKRERSQSQQHTGQRQRQRCSQKTAGERFCRHTDH